MIKAAFVGARKRPAPRLGPAAPQRPAQPRERPRSTVQRRVCQMPPAGSQPPEQMRELCARADGVASRTWWVPATRPGGSTATYSDGNTEPWVGTRGTAGGATLNRPRQTPGAAASDNRLRCPFLDPDQAHRIPIADSCSMRMRPSALGG
ncbi:hypothetical protein GCM10010279_64950 [Streptomyces mutabilis]|nr:hypothetical protein GCM10010279_64950 [Streptomyces mutabilis]